jgi:hypothetical protein
MSQHSIDGVRVDDKALDLMAQVDPCRMQVVP